MTRKTRPVLEHTTPKRRPMHKHTTRKTRPVLEHTTPKRRPMHKHTTRKRRPMLEHTTRKRRPMHKHTTRKRRPMHKQTTRKTRLMRKHTTRRTRPMLEHTTRKRRPMHKHTTRKRRLMRKHTTRRTRPMLEHTTRKRRPMHKHTTRKRRPMHKQMARKTRLLLNARFNNQLVYVQALWRHGDRAPKILPYPKDENTELAWPRGWAQLTNVGMRQLYDLGSFFRRRYGSFIGEEFNVTELLRPGHYNCPTYNELWDQQKSSLADAINKEYADVFNFLVNATGFPSVGYRQIYPLYGIVAEVIHGLPQPDWVYRRWPSHGNLTTLEIIVDLERLIQMSEFNTSEKAILRGGYIAGNWLDRALNVSMGIQTNPSKMMLFSAHDDTLTPFMFAMKINNGLLVPYAACIIMEIFATAANEFAVKLLYRNETFSDTVYELVVPQCEALCPISKLAEILSSSVYVNVCQLRNACNVKDGYSCECAHSN
ncbi:Testicular acid phosphatase -like protein [Toxocara canis]|uniref:Testicular acid phosphatase-like protein n=1 Tax=Toxocara canis TaxID=6265 RepID=A0A0B2VPP2_TOXCA|nr:Testicular acid phosphatase -like protein [Toxocara canis]